MIYLCTCDISVSKRWEEVLRDKSITSIERISDIKENNSNIKIVFLDLDSCFQELQTVDLENLSRSNQVRVMAFEKKPNPQTGKRLLSFGVKAYANTWMMPVHIYSALDTVQNGGIWLYPEFVYSLVNEVKPKSINTVCKDSPIFEKFTTREQELARLVLLGWSNGQIARHLSISERTVKAHISNILKKSHVRDRLSFVLLMKE